MICSDRREAGVHVRNEKKRQEKKQSGDAMPDAAELLHESILSYSCFDSSFIHSFIPLFLFCRSKWLITSNTVRITYRTAARPGSHSTHRYRLLPNRIGADRAVSGSGDYHTVTTEHSIQQINRVITVYK